MGAILILVVALLVAIGPSNSPAQVGLLLTYTVSLVQMFGMLTRQAAEGMSCRSEVEECREAGGRMAGGMPACTLEVDPLPFPSQLKTT